MSRTVESSWNLDQSDRPLARNADLDAHAIAALDRLTRWAAKALRAPAALISLGEDGHDEIASCTSASAEWASRTAEPLARLAAIQAAPTRDRLEQETERAHRHTRSLSVVLVDVDHFKMINDRFGHAAGDSVLIHLANNLRAVMRSGDLLARIGGDELAMILPDCRPQKAALVTRRMLAAVESKSMSQRHGVTLSAGVAGLTVGLSADDLLRSADQALYRAKDGGRNQVVTYELDLPEHADMRISA